MLVLLILCLSLFCVQCEDNAEFLFENAKLCGDPFSDPIWIPVLDLCNIECNQDKEYCVENEELQQQCKALPEECQKLLQQRGNIQEKKNKFDSGVIGGSGQFGKAEHTDSLTEKGFSEKFTLFGSGDAQTSQEEIIETGLLHDAAATQVQKNLLTTKRRNHGVMGKSFAKTERVKRVKKNAKFSRQWLLLRVKRV